MILGLIGSLFTATVSIWYYHKTLNEARIYIDEEISQIADLIVAYNMPLPKRWSMPMLIDMSTMSRRMKRHHNDFNSLPFLPDPSLADLFDRHKDIIIAPLYSRPGDTFYFPLGIEDGFYSVMINDKRVRSYVATNAQGIRFVVARPLSIIDAVGQKALQASLSEFWVLLALYLSVLLLIVNLMFVAVRKLAREIDARRENDLRPLMALNIPSELDVFIDALNRLFRKTSESLQNERRFIADAAHEMRTPLTALTLQAESIDEKKLDPVLSEKFSELKKAIRRQRDLTNSLLTYAKTQSHIGHVDKDFELKELLIELIEELGPLADDKNIDFGIDGNVSITVHSDRALVKTILSNLVGNAIKYTPPDGQVDLAAHENENELRIYVRDTGPGIPKKDLAHVFSAFYRVGGDTAKISGTGLGLAIVKSTCIELGANIELKNRQKVGLEACVTFQKR